MGIAPSTCYPAKTRPPSARALAYLHLVVEIAARVHGSRDIVRGLYGAWKVWRHLEREGKPVAVCTIDRLMGAKGIRGVVRGACVRTTIADEQASRPPDRADRSFHAQCPNRLWVLDLTYAPTWSGVAHTAFVVDAFSRRIVG